MLPESSESIRPAPPFCLWHVSLPERISRPPSTTMSTSVVISAPAIASTELAFTLNCSVER